MIPVSYPYRKPAMAATPVAKMRNPLVLPFAGSSEPDLSRFGTVATLLKVTVTLPPCRRRRCRRRPVGPG